MKGGRQHEQRRYQDWPDLNTFMTEIQVGSAGRITVIDCGMQER
jgi:hypothetical protein